MRLDQADRIMLGDREVSRVYLGANLVWQKFSPANLFAQGEPGVWYDPSDFSTMFQDPAGTTPVTAVEQPVGLMLDKSKGLVLGPELVTNGDFSDGGAGWTVGTGWSVGGGVATFTPGASGNIDQNIGAVNGSFYIVSLTYTRSAGTLNIRVGSSGINSVSFAFGSGATVTLILPSIGIDNYIRFNGSSIFQGTIDNISVRELPGHHARQNTATDRPIYRASPARIDFDTVDDALITTFPASLGSNCTIARAIPGVGAQILTGQTVGTTFSDTTDHAGLVIINRALTPSETTALTAYLNAKVAA